MKYTSEIIVKTKKQVKDVKGETIKRTIQNNEFAQNVLVQTGAYYEISFDAIDNIHAKNIINDIAKKLLANPIIEEYTIPKI